MHQSSSTYHPSTSNATYSGIFVGCTFAGKVRDEETGLSCFGARYYDADLTTNWLSVDPMADKYPSFSPYAYCAWNPVKLVDPDGCEINPVFDAAGIFLGCTKEGYCGEPIIIHRINLQKCLEQYEVPDISELSSEQILNYGSTFDKVVKQGGLSIESQVNIYKDIISKLDNTQIDGHSFQYNKYKVRYYNDSRKNAIIGTNVKTKTFFLNHEMGVQDGYYETTVENIQCTILNHEWYGHIINKWGNGEGEKVKSQGGTHYKCYEQCINSELFKNTTDAYKKFQWTQLDALSK